MKACSLQREKVSTWCYGQFLTVPDEINAGGLSIRFAPTIRIWGSLVKGIDCGQVARHIFVAFNRFAGAKGGMTRQKKQAKRQVFNLPTLPPPRYPYPIPHDAAQS